MAEEPTSLTTTEMHPIHPVQCLQIALYVMCGGGTVGLRAAEHPATFKIRPGTTLPYTHRRIYATAAQLMTTAQAYGLDPCALPPLAGPRLMDLTRFFRSVATAHVNDHEGGGLSYDDGYFRVGPILYHLWH